jgi:predicted transcriptional regulator
MAPRDRSEDKQRGGRPRLQDTLRLSAAGSGMMLGDLEHRVLEAVWSAKRPLTARGIHERVARTHDVVYITCVTVANRLVQKELLRRDKQDELYHYSATLSREEFAAYASRYVVQRIVGLGPAAVASSLVDVLAEAAPEQLAELGRLVRRKLRNLDE